MVHDFLDLKSCKSIPHVERQGFDREERVSNQRMPVFPSSPKLMDHISSREGLFSSERSDSSLMW